MKPKYIICENKAERDAVLKKLEKQGYVWVGEGEKPTEWNYSGWEDDETVYFNLSHSTRKISWGNVSSRYFLDEPEMLKITANNFLRNNGPILITRKGRVVTAENKNTGEKAIATCSPTDTFDFGTGAMIAVARLIAKTLEALTDDVKAEWKKVLGIEEVKVYTDDDRNFKVGDRVVVRDWGDMAKEYGAEGNDIRPDECTTSFTSKMKHLCGRAATITDVDDDYVRVKFDDESGDTNWYFRRWMFNPIDFDRPTTKFKVGDLVTLREGVKEGDHFGHLDVECGAMFDQSHHKPIKVIEITKVGSYYCIPADGDGTGFYYHDEMLEPWDENKIREGDIVKVIDTGLNYSTYPQWVGEHISDPDMAARYCFGSPSDGGNYKVIKIAEHESNGRTLAYIEQCDGFVFNRCYLVEVKGLEKVTE